MKPLPANVAALAERQLTSDEFRAYVEAPWAPGELEAWREQVAWFRRRYPTPAARLASARRAYFTWTRARGLLRAPTRHAIF